MILDNLTASAAPLSNFSCANSAYSYEKRVLYGTLGALLSSYIFLVNLALFVAFLRDKQVRRVPGHVLIVGLMVSTDIIIGVLPLPGYLLYNLCGGWPLGRWTCDLWITVDYISTNVSMVSVTAVAFDRFLATNFVFTHKRWMHRANQVRLCIGLWLITALRNILVFPLWANISDFRATEPEGQCGHPLYNNFAMGLLQRTLALYIPMILLVFFYGAVVFRILQSSPHFHSQPRKAAINNNNPAVNDEAKILHRGSRMKKDNCANGASNTKAKKRVTISRNSTKTPTIAARISKSFRIVTCVIVSFLLANLPWHIIENMIATGTTTVRQSDPIYILFWIMCYMNAFLNPIFYPFMHIEYKRLIIRWFRGDCSPSGKRLRNMVRKNDILINSNLILASSCTTNGFAGDQSNSLVETGAESIVTETPPPRKKMAKKEKIVELVQYVTTT